jgi:hypothetical protein
MKTSILYLSGPMRTRALIRQHQIDRLERLFTQAKDSGSASAMRRILSIKEKLRIRSGITLEVLLYGEKL